MLAINLSLGQESTCSEIKNKCFLIENVLIALMLPVAGVAMRQTARDKLPLGMLPGLLIPLPGQRHDA